VKLNVDKIKTKDAGVVIGNPPLTQVAEGNIPLYQVEFAGVYCRKETFWDHGSC
jgi:hypothetical protein